jgi:flagellar biosynthesis protein FlhA
MQKEADFYGAMDGASKFVRGDAVAGILITLVNVVGGFAIGVFQMDLSLASRCRSSPCSRSATAWSRRSRP